MKIPTNGAGAQPASTSDAAEVEKKRIINPELWQACAGPLINMPVAGTHVIYFPQGHCEQVAASMKKDADAQIPSYPNLPSQLLCLLHNVTLLADRDTDEVYALMTLQPVPSFDKDALLRSDLSMKANKPQTEFFCKTLTASDTSTHGGFSVPRHAAEKTFPPLDFTMQPPAQELVARDLHDNVWTFRHIYRGQPKRHLLTTGWSSFVGGKRLFAGDSVLFIRDEKQQLLLGIRRANRQTTNLSSSVLSSDSMHIGILAAAAHAASNNSPFTVFYNPRASPSEFVIPLAKYYKAACSKQISLGMRFRMTFETEESGTRRYMGTITGISDLDSVRWKNSQWRNLQVGWDESTAGERRNRVSIWEIEPVTAPFFICPTTPFFCSKCLRQLGMQDDDLSDPNNQFRQPMPWLGDNFGTKETQALLGLSLVQWMNMQPNPSLTNSDFLGTDLSCQLGFPVPQLNNLQFNAPRPAKPIQQLDQLQTPSASTLNPLASIIQTQQQFTDTMQPPRQNIMNQTLPTSQVQAQLLQSRSPIQAQNILQQQQSILNNQVQRSLPQNLPQQQENPSHVQHQDLTPFKSLDHASQQFHVPENQIQLQLIQKLHPQQQSLLAQQSAIPQPFHLTEQQDQQKLPLDASQKYSWSMIDPLLEASQSKLTMLPQHVILPQMGRKNSQTNLQFAHPKLQQHQQSGTQSELHMFVGNTSNPMNSHLSTGDSSTFKRPSTGGGQSGITDEFPSCSTSPSTKSCPSAVQSMMNGRTYRSTLTGDEIAQSSATLLSSGVKNVSSDGNLVKDFQQKLNIKTSLNISKNQGSGDFSNNLSSEGEMLSNYENPKETHLELSLSMVSPSFGVSDMAFNSIDSRINDSSLMNGGVWAPPPQIPRMRTYTKVYKHGAVGRSIDIARYMGYEDLKQDLARRFGIEGQLEDGQRIGWKLVYVDHENDVLMVGDDPWEEFVNCVRCIKILSPQEVQQISLDEDFGNPSKLRF